ncbi:DUF3427 domain-containing protein [Macrococcus equipercicus]|uniref:DUF3427 domain-containing protein n=1 Tax=Macrococcus equipercicus TaxID=69967 RepID=A0A9Q9BL95_9STAP|nr:DUF3427 domain-containing protein [Macrococcus equipercicus]UTH13250.1 DUF3427 domain-containing protein [Macrococcus equipercicus]
MEQNFKDHLLETPADYKVNPEQILINNKLLTKEESIQYFLNSYEQKVSQELSEYLDQSSIELAEYISNRTSQSIKSIPFRLSLYGNKSIEKYRHELTNDFQLLESKLITNDHQSGNYLINHLKNELLTCDSFDIIVSFIRGSGLNMLVNTLNILREIGIQGRIITSTYMNVTEPKALSTLLNYSNIKVKVYQSSKATDSFHTKAYVFHRKNHLSSVIVGSSNISAAALKTGEEWNIRTFEKASDSIYLKMMNRFNKLWSDDKTKEVNEEFIKKYANYMDNGKVIRPYINSFNISKTENLTNEIKPNSMQKTAIENLLNSITKGHKRGLAIAATGTGKTYLSAMCAQQVEPENVLFIAHRIELLEGAIRTFKNIFKDEPVENFVIYKGPNREFSKFTFASVQSLANDVDNLDPQLFDFIIIDEFHHATASTYMKIIDHLQPNFLLGLTATPERTDNGDIYGLAEYNIIVDVRLKHALESELLVPFQYYGISDNTVDFAINKGINEKDIIKLLSTNTRVDFVIEKMSQYTLSGSMKGLAFCQNKEHAKYMNEEFLKRGFNSQVLTSENSDIERLAAIRKLEDEEDPLEIIFIVDLFNEGIDIPKVNLVLFLRPTESAIIFTQQLGRGLRKFEGKEYLTVLDFVTNDRKSYLVPIALSGNKEFGGKEKLKSLVENNFNNLSENVHIEMDYKTKERILKAIDQQDFMSSEFIKKEIKQFLEVVRIETKQAEKKLSILDFYNFEDAPNLSIVFKGTYQSLPALNKAIKEARAIDEKILKEPITKWLFEELTKLIPIKRLYDILSILLVLKNQAISLDDIQKFIEHTFSISLNQQARTKIELAMKRTSKLQYQKQMVFNWNEEEQILENPIVLDNDIIRELDDYLSFVVASYQQEIDVKLLNQEEELELYKEYSRIEVAALVGFDKDLSSWRDGVKQYKGNHYLFVNLEKDQNNVEEHLLYDDYFISSEYFHWQSQNKTSQQSPTGQQYINHKRDNHKIHLFVRRKNTEDKRTLPFYYVGQVDFVSAKGNNPISIVWKLQQPVPKEILNELEY